MNIRQSDILSPLAFCALSLFVLDASARLFYLYWTFWWMDILTHFLGGVVVALFFVLFPFVQKGTPKQVFKKLLLIILTIGVLWEIYEVIFGLTFTSKIGYNLDTTIDLIMDTLGMIVAYFYLIKK